MSNALHVLLAQSGDREAFEVLLKSIQDPLFRHIERITRERATAEDVLQDVFVLIFRKLRWLNDPELFKPWAYRIATRAALERMKRERRTESVDPVEIASVPNVDRMLVAAQIDELLARVSPASRAVLSLHYLEDMSLPDIAAILGIPLGTVKSRLAYGLTRLREAFNA